MIGYLYANFNPKKISTGIKAVLVAATIHGVYNILSFWRNETINLVIPAYLGVFFLFLVYNLISWNRQLAR
jgi:hypothetical protein